MESPQRRVAASIPCRRSWIALTLFVSLFATAPAMPVAQSAATAGTAIASPETFFGFRMGTDGKLAAWPDIERYFTQVAESSDRVELVSLGKTTEGRNLLGVAISAPENIARLEQIRLDNLRLSDPRTLSSAEADDMVRRQPAVVAIGASIHASEIGATQAANELLHELATSEAPKIQDALRSLVIILLPSLNPDGHTLVVDWFQRTVGTPFEASSMPWLYHRYAGHDINRDAFMLNLVENQNLARFFYRVWHPQVFLTMHQMGPRGPRFFVPPNYDPIDPNYDPLLWRTAGLLGNAMALQLERDGKAGVVQNALFDYYWPGYEDSAPLGHNTVCLLTEVASVLTALPIDIRPNELSGSARGLPEYRPQVNFPNPWRGGLWRLRDIVEYDISAVRGLLDATTRYRRELLENFYAMGQRAITRGSDGDPFAFIIPSAQHDPHATAALVNLLLGAAVEVQQAIEPFRANERDYPAGTLMVLMAQPYRAYAKTLLERQDYPVRRLVPNGPAERPYDVSAWTLPYQMGVSVDIIEQAFRLPATSRVERAQIPAAKVTADRRASHFIVDARGNGGAIAINRLHAAGIAVQWTLTPSTVAGTHYPAGTLLVPATSRTRPVVERVARELGLAATGIRAPLPRDVGTVARARVGLYKPWVENIDEGWTRWLLERYEFPFVSLTDADIRSGKLEDRLDVIVLPDAPPERIIAGNPRGSLPDPYTGGIGEPGIAALQAFVTAGGSVVCLDSSCGLAIDIFGLPVKEVLKSLPPDKFFCPGSILRLRVDRTSPISFGMTEETTAFFSMSSGFEITPTDTITPGPDLPNPPVARAVAWYGSDNPLMSGWLDGPAMIADKPASIDARVGRGRVVLIGFRAQHRAQTHASFRFLFNSLYAADALRPAAIGTRRPEPSGAK
jgi:hypothetical protein